MGASVVLLFVFFAAAAGMRLRPLPALVVILLAAVGAGISAGLALAGYRPIAEVMFGDFLTLCFDQIVNHIAKYEAMYDGQATCPVIIRSPSGGGRGYGPTHSQSLEKHFLGVPHLRVVAGSGGTPKPGSLLAASSVLVRKP